MKKEKKGNFISEIFGRSRGALTYEKFMNNVMSSRSEPDEVFRKRKKKREENRVSRKNKGKQFYRARVDNSAMRNNIVNNMRRIVDKIKEDEKKSRLLEGNVVENSLFKDDGTKFIEITKLDSKSTTPKRKENTPKLFMLDAVVKMHQRDQSKAEVKKEPIRYGHRYPTKGGGSKNKKKNSTAGSRESLSLIQLKLVEETGGKKGHGRSSSVFQQFFKPKKKTIYKKLKEYRKVLIEGKKECVDVIATFEKLIKELKENKVIEIPKYSSRRFFKISKLCRMLAIIDLATFKKKKEIQTMTLQVIEDRLGFVERGLRQIQAEKKKEKESRGKSKKKKKPLIPAISGDYSRNDMYNIKRIKSTINKTGGGVVENSLKKKTIAKVPMGVFCETFFVSIDSLIAESDLGEKVVASYTKVLQTLQSERTNLEKRFKFQKKLLYDKHLKSKNEMKSLLNFQVVNSFQDTFGNIDVSLLWDVDQEEIAEKLFTSICSSDRNKIGRSLKGFLEEVTSHPNKFKNSEYNNYINSMTNFICKQFSYKTREKNILRVLIAKYVFLNVGYSLYSREVNSNYSKEELYQKNMILLKPLGPLDLGIKRIYLTPSEEDEDDDDDEILEDSFDEAVEILNLMEFTTDPNEMLHLLRVMGQIIQEIARENCYENGEEKFEFGMDDFFPVLVFVVARSGVFDCNAKIDFMNKYAKLYSTKTYASELDYLKISFQAAIQYILNITQEQLDQLLEKRENEKIENQEVPTLKEEVKKEENDKSADEELELLSKQLLGVDVEYDEKNIETARK